MKRSFIIIFLMIAISSGCKKIKDATAFTFNIEKGASFDLPATPFAGTMPITLPLPLPPMATNSQATLDSYKTSSDHVDAVNLTKLTMSISQPSSQTFNFLKSIYIYLDANGQQQVMLASLDSVPHTGLSLLNLNTSSANLKNYILQDTIRLSAKAIIRESVDTAITLNLDMNFAVKARLLD